jgi:hypothetical protein
VNRSTALTSRPSRALTVGLLLIACLALTGGKQPEEYLDEETAATITVVGEPLVFANPRRDLAANARDYVTVAAAAVDRAGKISYVLITYIWSTVDPALRRDALPSPEALIVQADDRRIEYHLEGHSAHEAGIGLPVHAPPGSAAAPNVYHTDLATLRFLAEARRLRVLPPSDSPMAAYELWDDRRTALRAFVRRMSGED